MTERKGRPRLAPVDYEQPSARDVAQGNAMRCVGCERDWPLRLCAIALRRCVNCAREWWREEKKQRRGHYWERYGLSERAAAEKLAAQGGQCAICRDNISLDETPRAQLDHCHRSGHPRGFLCGRCNRGLGVFGDQHDLLRSAAQYLAKHGVTTELSEFRRPRRKRVLRGLPVKPRKPHHVLTESGRRVDLSDPNLSQLMHGDAEVAEAVEKYIEHKASSG